MTDIASLYEAPALLARAGRSAGSGPDLTQGAGGNVSLKTAGGRMLIKASGARLRDVSPSSGWALTDSGLIAGRLRRGPAGEDELSDLIRSATIPVEGLPAAKPSIETGFHSLLNSAVVHVHSAYANVLNMSEEGASAAARLFPGAVLVPYRSPGAQLCSAIAVHARPSEEQVFFLAGHGLAVSHPDVDGALALNGSVNSAIRRGLSLPPYPEVPAAAGLTPHNAARLAFYGRDFMLDNVLSPDQALYCGPEALSGAAGPDVNEVLTALFYVLDCVRGLGWKPRFLSKDDVAYLGTMTGGRYARKEKK